MIRNRFAGFDNEFDLSELSTQVSQQQETSPYQRMTSASLSASAMLTEASENLIDIAQMIQQRSGSVGNYQSIMPTSLSSSFFVDQIMLRDASGWVETNSQTRQLGTGTVAAKYNREDNSGSATGESTYLDLLSDLLGGLSFDQLNVIRSLQYTNTSNNRLVVAENSDLGEQYVDGSFVGQSDFDYHGSSCPCCKTCSSTQSPEKLGGGGGGGGDQNDFAPIVTAIGQTLEMGRFLNVTSFFSYYDYDGNPLQSIRVIDKGASDASGYWFYNGARVQANQWIEVSVDHLDRLRFYAGQTETNEAIGVMVSDGKFWSGSSFARVITTPANLLPPTARGFDGTVLSSESVKLEDYILAEDPENNLLKMRIIDRISNVNSGWFAVDGVVQTQGQWFEITVDQLSLVDYHGAKNAQAEYVAYQVYDGKFWSNVANFKMTTTFNYYRPVVSAAEVELDNGAEIQVGRWLTFSDQDGNTAKRFRFYDTGASANGGYFTVDGVVQNAQQWFEVAAKDMSSVVYHAADNADFEKYRVMAYDGRYWSSISTGSVTVRVSPTADMPDTLILRELETVFLKDVLSVTGNGVSLKTVYVYEPLSETNGTLSYLGSRLETGKVHEFTWAEFANLAYTAAPEDAGRYLDNFLIKFDNGLASTPWERINVVTEVIGNRALTSGFSWSTNPGEAATITYSFPLAVPFYYPDDADERTPLFTALTAAQRNRIRDVLDLYAEMSGLTFVEVPESVGGMMRFAFTDLPDGVLGWAYYPDAGKPNNTTNGDVWFDDVLINDAFADGTEGWLTAIHEIGHALGLAHPFTPKGESGIQLPTDTDNHFYTEMSYTRTSQVTGLTSVTGPYGVQGATTGYGIDTPMLYDLVEIQRLYGSSPDQNPDDDIYTWSSMTPFRETLRDTAGVDTFNASNFGIDQTIDLRSGHFSTIGQQDYTVMTSYDTVIENAIGGAGSDILIGNEVNNLLYGNGANDTLEGGGGVDFMSGFTGDDTYIWRLGDGWDVIDENRGAGRDVIRIYGNHSIDNLPYGTMNELENDFVFRRLGRDLRIDFTIDRGEAVGGITIKDYAWGGSRVESMQIFGANGSAVTPMISLYSIFQQATDVATHFQLTNAPSPLGFIATPVA